MFEVTQGSGAYNPANYKTKTVVILNGVQRSEESDALKSSLRLEPLSESDSSSPKAAATLWIAISPIVQAAPQNDRFSPMGIGGIYVR